MSVRKEPAALLLSAALAGLGAFVTLTAALAQTNEATAFDPLKAYVGKWLATNPGESAPFLALTLSEASGGLTGTMSPFTVGSVRNGSVVWRPLPYVETEISDLRISDSSFSFHWMGDPPLHAGEVKFVAEGTDVAYINLPLSQEEMSQIYADNRGLRELYPTIHLRRERATSGEYQPRVSARDWKEESTTALINEAEFQYKFDHGVYADYPTLLHSGQLGRTKGFNCTIVPIDLHSEADPVPGHVVRLMVAGDGSSYFLQIGWKVSADCGGLISSDQTGIMTERHTGGCATSR